jgi:pyruvate kinase
MKKTKIVATVSSHNCSREFIQRLYENGMNVVRLNSAHQSIEGAARIIWAVREVSREIAIMMDTKGPEIRTLPMASPMELLKGQRVLLTGGELPGLSSFEIQVSHRNIAGDVPPGSRILIADGDVQLGVDGRDGDILRCTALHDCTVEGRKGVNVPGVHIDLPAVSERDVEYMEFAAAQGMDFIAHSFVRSRGDIDAVQSVLDRLGSSMKIIAKIENHSGVTRIDEILEAAYGIMVARGDLAIEIPFEQVPGIQKMLVSKCIQWRKPVIVATQMLHSMIEHPRPTRAEVSDVASAIYDQTDAVMLSGETAIGKYPEEAVRTMAAIAIEAERNKAPLNDIPPVVINNDISAYLIKAAVKGAVRLDASAIVADTTSGRTIRSLCAYRGAKPVLAQCYREETVRELALSYGVSARYMEPLDITHEFIGRALERLLEDGLLSREDRVVVVAGNFGRSRGVSFVEAGSVANLLESSVGNKGVLP